MELITKEHEEADKDKWWTKDEFAPFAHHLLKSESVFAYSYYINEDDSEKGVGKSSTKGIEHATPQDSTTSPLLVIIARHTATSNVTDCRDVGG